ncbi:MAG: aminotransferase class V-fold PLP-dependent enzyme [Candidatus Latescibacterota bacterium]|nr:aminotransferase class V-fold PLP-dependent enzyme [Candidatus Latescibacterota bacterium]
MGVYRPPNVGRLCLRHCSHTLLHMTVESSQIATWRADFPALKEYIWFQNGGVSITPSPVAIEHNRLMQELLNRGPMHIVHPEDEIPRRQDTLNKLASFFSVAPQDICLMRGVSEAFQTVLRGMDWNAGDQIIITEDEEAALLLPVLHLRDRYDVEVIKAPLIDGEVEQLEAISDLFTERTRLLAISHVTTDLGFRLPVAPICKRAKQRGIRSFVDLAHSAGLYTISLKDLHCDYAGILSYKWMYAPYASGLLYVNPKSEHTLEVTFAGGRSEKKLDFVNDSYELRDSAERFQYGPWSWPLVHSWAFTIDYLNGVGFHTIWARTNELTLMLKDGLKSIPGVELYTPYSTNLSAALVSFGLANWKGSDLVKELRKRHNILIKCLPHTREGLRASVTYFNLDSEIELLINAVRDLASE